MSPLRLEADPLGHGLGWQPEYVGKTKEGAGRSLPLYRIVEYQHEPLRQERADARR